MHINDLDIVTGLFNERSMYQFLLDKLTKEERLGFILEFRQLGVTTDNVEGSIAVDPQAPVIEPITFWDSMNNCPCSTKKLVQFMIQCLQTHISAINTNLGQRGVEIKPPKGNGIGISTYGPEPKSETGAIPSRPATGRGSRRPRRTP